jgi:hypothetical protein
MYQVGALRTRGTFKTGAGSKADFTYSGNAFILFFALISLYLFELKRT